MTDRNSTLPEFSDRAVRVARRFPWRLFFTIVVVALFGGAGVVFGVVQWLRRDLASPQTLASIQPAVKTLVYDARGRVIHEFYKENRSPVPLKQIPRHIVNATIATEDRRFYSHWGIDLWGIARAAVTDIMQMRRAQGGSTITQLLARNLFLSHERTFSRKIKEAALAIEIERTYSKDQILEMYFNQIYFGEGAYGVEAGAKTLFNKPLRELNLQESALLAGIPANPSLYSPRRRPAAARARREKVLRNMLVTKAISQVEYDNAVRAPLGVTPVRYSNDRAPYFIEMVRLQLDEKFGSNAVYEGGLRVYTTLDLDLQQIGERALEKHLAALESELKIKQKRESFVPAISDSTRSGRTPYLQGALIAIDPRTGYVRAMVGGRDWNHSNFNRATQAQRQPGSSFKPFVYVAAIDNGFHPTDVIVDEPVSFPGGNGKAYQPLNYDRKFRGPVTLRYALQQSINIPAIKLMRKVGISLVASYARRLGIRTPLGSQNLSLALGSSEVTLIDLTTAYGVFANRGIRNDPLLILKVEDDKGTVLEKNTPHPVEVLSEETASVMTSMLQSVMDHGTGFPSRTRGFTNPAAGKTGTMDDYMDAWFVGYTPALSCGVWVGFDQKRTIGPGMTGARAALPVWTDFMIGATRGRPIDEFPLPVGTVTREICAETGMLATTACVSVTSEMFGEGSEPSELCTQHPGPPLRPLEPGVTPAPESHGPTDTERAPEDPVGVR